MCNDATLHAAMTRLLRTKNEEDDPIVLTMAHAMAHFHGMTLSKDGQTIEIKKLPGLAGDMDS